MSVLQDFVDIQRREFEKTVSEFTEEKFLPAAELIWAAQA